MEALKEMQKISVMLKHHKLTKAQGDKQQQLKEIEQK